MEREVERYLRQEGKLREMDQMDGCESVCAAMFIV